MSIAKFVHFGCWNNLNVNNGLGLNQVMETLNAYVHEQPVEFIIVAGDNYYPDKKQIKSINSKTGKQDKVKTKIIKPTNLSNGFNLLPTGIPINMILGNHDLETNLKNNLFIENEPDKLVAEKDCFIIQSEVASTLNTNIDLVLFKSQRMNDTLCLMIDTSLYTLDINDYLPCYNKFFENTEQQFATKEELIEYQNAQIFKAITDNMVGLKHIIISGHHPIIGVKMKEGESKVLNDIPDFEPVLQQICKITNNMLKYYYLCADLHLYQKGKIEFVTDDGNAMEINQYIVGTGGTELDDEVPGRFITNQFNNGPNMKYTLEDCQHTYGFLECVLETGVDPTFNFIPASPVSESGGSKQTKRKYKKRKYKKLKSQYTCKRRRNITHKKRYK
jgi:hypothetical protein